MGSVTKKMMGRVPELGSIPEKRIHPIYSMNIFRDSYAFDFQ